MESLVFGGFRKVNESVSPERLQPDEVTVLENMRLDEPIGEASTRKGFSRYSLEVDTAGAINNIYDVVDKNGANYLISAIATKVRKSLNGSGAFSDIKTGLTGSLKTRMANYGGKFFFTNGTNSPFYSELAASDVQGVEIESPDIDGVVLSTDATAPTILTAGIYRYLLVYRTADGHVSNPSVRMEVGAEYAVALKSIAFLDLPVATDTRIITKQLFRTIVNGFNTFYLVATLENSVTTYTDRTPDSALDTTTTAEYLNTPKSSFNVCVNSDRILFANLMKAYTNRVIPPSYLAQDGGSAYFTATTGGSMAAGDYQYWYSYVDQDGNESALVYFSHKTISAPNNAIELRFFPLPIVSTGVLDTKIKYIRFYRSTVNDVTPPYEAYWIGDFAIAGAVINSQYYKDIKADASLGAIYPKETTHNPTEQVSLRSSIIYSNPFKPLEYPELNYIEIFPDDGDQINGIFNDDNGIVVFKEKSICKLFTNGDPSNWSVVKISENIGCDEPDSIFKYEKSYFFVYKNMPYVLDGGSVKPIGYDRKPTFDSVTTFLGATFWDKALWYVLAVYITDTYYLLCYDTKLGTWYKFNLDTADCVARKEFGTDAGKLLIGGDLYINQYDEAQTYDTDNAAEIITFITPELRTKTYLFQDSFTTARLMFLFLNYERMISTTSGQAIFTITNPETAADKQLVDEDDTPIGGLTQAIYKVATDGMTGTLKRAKKLYLNMTGQGIAKFYGAKLEYNTEEWNVTRKHNA